MSIFNSCNFTSNAFLASLSSFNFCCRLFLSSIACLRDLLAWLHCFSSSLILLFNSSTTLSNSVREAFDFLKSWLREWSCLSFWSSSFFHFNTFSLASISTEDRLAVLASRFSSSSIFSSCSFTFSSSTFLKRFSRSRYLFSAIVNDFFSSSSLLTQAVRSCWLFRCCLFTFSNSCLRLSTLFLSLSSSVSSFSEPFFAISNATATSAFVRLKDSASFSLCSNILVFSVASAVTVAICFSLFANAAPNFSFCKLSFSIRLRTSLISRDNRVPPREFSGVDSDGVCSMCSLSSASCSWRVNSARSWMSSLLLSWISRFVFSAFSSLSVDIFSSFLNSCISFSARANFNTSSSNFVTKDAFSFARVSICSETYSRIFVSPAVISLGCVDGFFSTDRSTNASKSAAWVFKSLSWSFTTLLSLYTSSNLRSRDSFSPCKFFRRSWKFDISCDFLSNSSLRSFSLSLKFATWVLKSSFSSSVSSKSSSVASSLSWAAFSELFKFSISSFSSLVTLSNCRSFFMRISSSSLFSVLALSRVSSSVL